MTRSYDIRPCGMGDVKDLCARFHGYHGAGSVAVYAFGVYEDGAIVAAYAWQPPPPSGAPKRYVHKLHTESCWPVLVTYADEGEGHTGYVYTWERQIPTAQCEMFT